MILLKSDAELRAYITKVLFPKYMKTYYSDPDLKDVRDDLEAIKFEMIDFAMFCVKNIKTIVTPR